MLFSSWFPKLAELPDHYFNERRPCWIVIVGRKLRKVFQKFQKMLPYLFRVRRSYPG